MNTSIDFIDMNTEAVTQMQKGNNNAASTLLRKALTGLRNEMNQTTQERPEDMQDDSEIVYEEIHLQSVAVFQPFLGLEIASHDSILPFYARAFVLSDSEEDDSRTAVTVLYNLALLYHSQALIAKTERGEVDHRLLSQARDFYEAAQTVAFSTWSDDVFRDMYCLVLALANNLGHVYGQTRTRVYDFSRTNSYLTYLVKLVQCPSLPYYVSEEDNEFFYLSVFTFLDASVGLSIAPAA